MLGALLSSPALPTRRLYGLDLVGLGPGGLRGHPGGHGARRRAGGSVAGRVLLAGAFAPAPHPVAAVAGPSRRLTALVLAVALVAPSTVFRMRYARDSSSVVRRPGTRTTPRARGLGPDRAYRGLARARARSPRSAWPSLFGTDRELLSRFRRVVTQNNNAFTYAPEYGGDPATLRGLGETVYAAAYPASLVPRPRVLVIGVGGGMDVLTALAFDAASVTGVEVNGATLEILRHTYRDYFRAWVEDPRVRLVHEEGRHFLASQPDRLRRDPTVRRRLGQRHPGGGPRLLGELPVHGRGDRPLPLAPRSRGRAEPHAAGIDPASRDAAPARERRGVAPSAGSRAPGRARDGPRGPEREFVAVLAQPRPFAAEQVRRVAAWAGSNPTLALGAAPGFAPSGPSAYAALLARRAPAISTPA